MEAANRMSLVECYHEPLRRVLEIIREECSNLDYHDVLRATVKSLNNITGPDGLIFTLLVFGAMPDLGTRQDPPNPDIAKRSAAVTQDTKEISKYFIQCQVKDAKEQRNGLNVTETRETPLGSYAMVYRECVSTGTSESTGPYILLDTTDGTETVIGPSGAKSFRLSFVNRFHKKQDTITSPNISQNTNERQASLHQNQEDDTQTIPQDRNDLNDQEVMQSTNAVPNEIQPQNVVQIPTSTTTSLRQP